MSLNPNKGSGVSVQTVQVDEEEWGGRAGGDGNPPSKRTSPPGNLVRPVPLVSGELLPSAVVEGEAEDGRSRGREGE